MHLTDEKLDIPEVLPAAAVQPACVADGVRKQLDPRFIQADAISGWISTAVFSGLILVVVLTLWVVDLIPTLGLALGAALWLLLTLAMVWITPRWPRWEYNATHYVVRPDGMEIHRGIFWKHIISVPRSRVQHIDIRQGPILRRFGLATLVLHTAGNQHFAVTLNGLAHETAVQIRDNLLQREPGNVH